MRSPKTSALENAFADELDEIIERVLLRYRPILSHAVLGSFRFELHLHLQGSEHLRPWLPRGPCRPVHGIGALTAGQVALLGGTRPMRILHAVAHELGLALDGGDRKSLHATERVLHHCSEALASLVEHHVVVPVTGKDAGLRRLRGLARLGVAAQIAAMMGALYEYHMWAGRRELEEAPDFIRRYFLGPIQVFGQIKLSRSDQGVFRDYYLDARDIEELADERGAGLEAEVERRHGFLKRLATALEAEVDALSGAAERRTVDPRAPDAIAGAPEPRALTRAAAHAGLPRKP